MTILPRLSAVAMIVIAATACASGQGTALDPSQTANPVPVASAPSKAQAAGASQPLFDFRESDIKFSLTGLMRTLRDSGHEGWVLAAYPDPKTKRPLIGAGFSLDVVARDHPQSDPLNPHTFLEPSSAQLWQAAGLDPERLNRILDRYDRDLAAWKARGFRRKLIAHALTPDVTDEEAMRLLRISAIQAVSNARAYCRSFDQLSASQQMALSQLVFQMGVNLEEFTQFLGALNTPALDTGQTQQNAPTDTLDSAHWKTVQDQLIASQWARLYSRRASTVIAMFDPHYSEEPSVALARVNATLRPAVVHRRKSGHSGSLRVVKTPRKRPSNAPHRRKAS
jgi:hypothetical protein